MESDLHPLSPTRLATDGTGAYLKRQPGSDEFRLAWKDTAYVLTPADVAYFVPTENVQAGRFEQTAVWLRGAQSSGFRLYNWGTRALTARADTLEAKNRPHDARRYNQIAVQLFPQSWVARAYLGNTYEALGRADEAARACRTVQALTPRRTDDVTEKFREPKRSKEEK